MLVEDVYAKILDVIRDLGGEATSYDIIMEFRARYGDDFSELVERYGCEGGRGSGKRYTPYVYLGKQISNLAKKGWLLGVGWKDADKDTWSAPKTRRWRLNPRFLRI
ncbi:hypothetical protein H5T87_02205 [bacterium]|nr:hypothetical protein [bacterium]